jgi:hypothetical protein
MGNRNSKITPTDFGNAAVSTFTFGLVNLERKNPSSCNYNMNNSEKKCYLDRYPDLQTAFGSNNLGAAQTHWRNYGCRENRNNQCPPPQSTAGAYTFQGCFNDKGSRAIPIKKDNVKKVEECRNYAQQSNKNVFGVQYFGECWVGDSIEDAKKYGLNTNKDKCGNMGKSWTNQVYAKDSPIPQPPPPEPVLTTKQFAVKEGFDNNNADVLNNGFNNLYNQIFCDLYYKEDDFHVCNNCQLTGAQKVWKTTSESSTNNCRKSCKDDKRCTSYNYNQSLGQNNCTQYLDFPTEIKENVNSNNAGYKLNYTYNYNKLSPAQQKNATNKCANQIINNFSHPNTDYSSCLSGVSGKENISTINFKSAECVYELLKKQGLDKTKNIDNYELDPTIKSKGDPIIDNYGENYNQFITKQVQNANVNNALMPDDYKSIDYNQKVEDQNNTLENNFSATIGDLENEQNNRTDLILAGINDTMPNATEGFSNIEENYNKSNSTKFFMFMIFIIFLFLLFIYFRK